MFFTKRISGSTVMLRMLVLLVRAVVCCLGLQTATSKFLHRAEYEIATERRLNKTRVSHPLAWGADDLMLAGVTSVCSTSLLTTFEVCIQNLY